MTDDLDLLLAPAAPEMAPETAPEEPHILTVTQHAGVVEYELTHPGCKVFQTHAYDPTEDGYACEAEAYSSASYDCAIGYEIAGAGFLDVLGVVGHKPGVGLTTTHLDPGTYTLTHWSTTYPSTPNGPAEYDAGVAIERIETPADQG